jgi:hypothetical protein
LAAASGWLAGGVAAVWALAANANARVADNSCIFMRHSWFVCGWWILSMRWRCIIIIGRPSLHHQSPPIVYPLCQQSAIAFSSSWNIVFVAFCG